MSNLKSLIVILALLGVVVGGVEEHGDPKEHKREGGKSKFSKTEQNKTRKKQKILLLTRQNEDDNSCSASYSMTSSLTAHVKNITLNTQT